MCQDHRDWFKQTMLNTHHHQTTFEVVVLSVPVELIVYTIRLLVSRRTYGLPDTTHRKKPSLLWVTAGVLFSRNTAQEDKSEGVREKHTAVLLPCSVPPCSWVCLHPDCPKLGSQPAARWEKLSFICSKRKKAFSHYNSHGENATL